MEERSERDRVTNGERGDDEGDELACTKALKVKETDLQEAAELNKELDYIDR